MRAFALLWGGWLVVTGLMFSYMQGIIHPYYMVALAPAIAALVAVGAISLWQRGLGWAGRCVTALGVAVTAWWAYELLSRSPSWLPWLRVVIVVAAVLAVVSILVTAAMERLGTQRAVAAATAMPPIRPTSRTRSTTLTPTTSLTCAPRPARWTRSTSRACAPRPARWTRSPRMTRPT